MLRSSLPSLLVLAVLAAALPACASDGMDDSRPGATRTTVLETTRPSRAYVNAFNVPGHGVALSGYSPVSYFDGAPERGDARHAVEFRGVTYHLTDAAQVARFQSDPARYEPAFGGWCAFGMSVEDKFPVDPTNYRIVGGRLFLFLRNPAIDAGTLWDQGDERELVRKATAHWKKVQG